jgi:hypothetical protein
MISACSWGPIGVPSRYDGSLMIRLLRRWQPRSPVLAFLYWVLVTMVVIGVLFVVFYFTDDLLPGQGMF